MERVILQSATEYCVFIAKNREICAEGQEVEGGEADRRDRN